MATKNYTLGRGKVYFSRFKTGTQVPEGFRYIGNTPEFNLTIESEELDHYSSDGGIREKDDSVPLEVTRNGSMITDNIDPENVALFFFGTASTVTQASVVKTPEEFTGVKVGHKYKLGISDSNPGGYFGISPTGFEVSDGESNGPATGTITFSGTGSADDTVTVGTTVYTLKAAPSAAYEVDIGSDATETGANLAAAINAGAGAGTAYGTGTEAHPLVSASAAAGVVTVTALNDGTAGNSIALAKSGTDIAVSAAAMAGGTGMTYVLDTDYSVDFTMGLVEILSGGSIADGDDITIEYAVRGSTRSRVISGSEPVEGAIIYEANNPKGDDHHYYLPYTKITPNGDYALKGDEWQQIPFNIEALKPTTGEAIYMDGVPAYS